MPSKFDTSERAQGWSPTSALRGLESQTISSAILLLNTSLQVELLDLNKNPRTPFPELTFDTVKIINERHVMQLATELSNKRFCRLLRSWLLPRS
ncbi:hypothetical protein L596_001784 [Steinernema carpocapsae]|uniref:Uncharacterized protein n=1 Tax=Steinernema carpocapsae TaxID=34508 RepID=A0A4U8UM91_STECR|nr:hypothetical protein L596_001784 [Steinernema carpocapsae]